MITQFMLVWVWVLVSAPTFYGHSTTPITYSPLVHDLESCQRMAEFLTRNEVKSQCIQIKVPLTATQNKETK
jgi:hypothetical protein